MKNLILLLITIALAGCSNICEDYCLNGGTLVMEDNLCTCQCPEGYSGTVCETESLCNLNNIGTLTVVNTTNYSYDLYIDDEYIGYVYYNDDRTVAVDAGTRFVQVKKSSNSSIHYEDSIVIADCDTVTWSFP